MMIEMESERQSLPHLASEMDPRVGKEGKRKGMPESWAETTPYSKAASPCAGPRAPERHWPGPAGKATVEAGAWFCQTLGAVPTLWSVVHRVGVMLSVV